MKYSALTLLLAAGAFAAESALPDFLPPATKAVFGVQVRRILNSPVAQEISPGAAAGALAGAGQMEAEWQKIVALTGFDPFQDIDEVLIACAVDDRNQGQNRGQNQGHNQGQNPPMLLIARGHFNVERFSANASLYHDVPVLGTDPSSTGTIALLDASTAIFGEIAEVHAAIDRRGSGASHDGALDAAFASTAASLRSRYDIWGLGDRPVNLIPQSSQPDGLDSIDRFQFGLSVTHGLEIAAEVHARSAKDAEKLMQSVQFLELMMKSQPAAESAKLEIHEEHGTIKLALTISEAELKKAMEAQRAARSRKPAGGGVTVTGPAAPPPQTRPAQITPASGGTMVFTLPGRQ
ncbi:MAG TPA: hypothetical protein VNY05_33320 [Candidatus Acidoferrales bacterium]|nr:hypothetical protein [Candidatus Acidoferrales bacterium]